MFPFRQTKSMRSFAALSAMAWRQSSASNAWVVIAVLAIVGCVAVFMVPGCFNSSDRAVAKSPRDSARAEDNAVAYRTAWDTFKAAVKEDIAANSERIAALRVKVAGLATSQKTALDKKIDGLEEDNNALNRKLERYEDVGEHQWQSFQHECAHDLKGLSDAFRDVTVDNVQ